MRTLQELSDSERASVIATIHKEAQAAGWHTLNNKGKGALYKGWESRFHLTHAAVKDGVMKGFDAAQHIPPSGEAAVHKKVVALLEASNVPYWRSKLRLWNGRAQADFALGYSRKLLTHTAELEPAPSWQKGLMQALWYKSAYYQESQIQAIPTLILFGDVSEARWEEIQTTCLDQRAALLSFDLLIAGEPAPAETSLEALLAPSQETEG